METTKQVAKNGRGRPKKDAQLDEEGVDRAFHEAGGVEDTQTLDGEPLRDSPVIQKVRKGGFAKKTDGDIIEIPPLDIRLMDVTIGSLDDSPLIVNKWTEKQKQAMRDKHQGRAEKAREVRVPVNESNGARHIDHLGRDCLPANYFRKTIAAATRFMKDATKVYINGAIFFTGPRWLPIEFTNPTEDELVGFEWTMPEGQAGKKPPVQVEDVVRLAGMGRPADLRYRPYYWHWSIVLPIKYDAGLITAEQVVNLINRAGYSIGVAEWRAEKGGDNGRFCVLKVEPHQPNRYPMK